jgi:hypothetical protein
MKLMPAPMVGPVTGNVLTWLQFAPLFVLTQRPLLIVPRYSFEGRFGSTIMRSPASRPLSLLPFLNGRLTVVKLAPWLFEIRICPLFPKDSEYIPTAR